MSTRAVCVLNVLLFTHSAVAAPKPAPAQPAAPAGRSVPSAGDVRELFEKGDYTQALRQAGVALAAKGENAAPDRYELLVLKGESLLRLKNNKDAAEAFDGAAGA